MVMKVKRETLEACMTCPLCHKLLKDATTISLCLHTFCRKCIYEKLSDEEMDCCPVCNIDLGCLPVEKLRPDHNLQDIRSKIFPFKRKNITAQEVVPSLFLPAKRKERSLSSLVVSAPKVSTHTGFTGKRTKTGTRKAAALHGSSFIAEKSIKTEETHYEDNLDSSIAESSKKHRPNEDTDNNMDLIEGKVDLWTPLNCLVEAANRTKSSRSNLQGTPLAKLELPTTPRGGLEMSETTHKSELPTSVQSELHIPKTENKNNGQKIKFGDDKDGNALPSGPVKRRRQRPAGQKRAAASEMSASAQVMLDATVNRCNRKNSPIWFSLVASEDQKGDVSEVASEIVEGLISEPNSPKSSAHIISSPSAPPMPLSIPSSSSTKLTFPSFSPTLREEYIKQQVELIEIEKYREMDLAISAQIWTALEEFYSNWNKWNLEYEERLERMALKKASCSEQAIAVWYLHHLLKQQKINKRLLAASTWKRSALPSSVQWEPSPAASPAPSPTHINPASAMVVYSPDSAQSSKSGCIEVSKEVFEKPVENNAKFEKFIETSTKRQDELAESRQTMLESQQRMLESQQRIIEMLKIILDRLAKPKEL